VRPMGPMHPLAPPGRAGALILATRLEASAAANATAAIAGRAVRRAANTFDP
jgi:hypothetical protein